VRPSHKPDRLYELDYTAALFAGLVTAAQTARAGPPQPKRFTQDSRRCSNRTRSRASRWFVRRPRVEACVGLHPAGTEIAATARTLPRARSLRRKAGVRISAAPSSSSLALSPKGITSAPTAAVAARMPKEKRAWPQIARRGRCFRTNPAALATLNTVDRSLSCLAATNWSPRRRARFHSTDVLAVAGVRK
jgi:hypothetical protein